MRSWARRVVVAALAAGGTALVLAAGALVVLMSTELGARQALRIAADRIPGELTIGGIDGNLYSGLDLAGVRYRNDTVDARFETLSIEPSWRELRHRRWVLSRLHVGDGRVVVAQSREAAPENAASAPAGNETSGGLLPDIPENVEIRDIRLENVDVDARGTPLRIEALAGSIRDSKIDVDRIRGDVAGASLDASAALEIDADRATGSLAGSVELPGGGKDDPAAAPQARSASERIELDTTFTFDERTGGDGWRATLDWTRLEWRRPEAASLASPTGRLAVEPRADGAFDVSLRAAVEGEPLPAQASLDASAAVSSEFVDVEHASLQIEDAEAFATGAFALDSRSGYASVEYRGVSPSLLEAGMDGALHGSVHVAIAATPALRLAGSGVIDGELDGRPLDGRVVASYADNALSIERGEVSLDDGRIVVGGMLAPDSADLRFSIDAPQIGNWYPPLSGTLAARGSIAGDTDDPRVDIDIDGEDLVLEGASMPPLERMTLRVDGTRAAHALRLEASSTLGRVRLEAEQHYEDGAVDGRLIESVLEPRDAGAWRLLESASYVASLNEFELRHACLSGPRDARICGETNGETVTLTARAVPNALAEPWLPEDFAVAGETDADVEITLGEPLSGSLRIRQDALRVGIRSGTADPDADGSGAVDEARARADRTDAAAGEASAASAVANGAAEAEVVPLLDLAEVYVSAVLGANALDIELTAGAAGPADRSTEDSPLLAPSAVAARLTLSPPAPEGRLDGFASARLTELGLLGALVDGIDGLSGTVEARVEVAGTLESPRVAGSIDAAELAAELPALGIEVSEGRLSADVPEIVDLDAVPFDAELCSMGCARVSGELSVPRTGDWTLTASVAGEDVLIVDRPDLRAVATPRLEIRATPELAAITGTIALPQGSIEVEDVPRSAVRPAQGTVVHGRETPEDDAENLPIPLSIDVEASLGDVRFEGLGVEAQLAGTLDVERRTDGDWIMQGTTTIEEGTFTAYGQTLTIARGLLVFTGPPDNPTLDIRATRVVDNAEVSLAITGTAENPRSEVFSEAGLSESEAFAQLFTGRSLGNLGESDPEALERAAIGLGLRRVLPTLGRIGAALGLDELSVEGADEAQGVVVASRQIGSDVYLRYRHGLFDDFSGLELIYRISERFRLRTETGTAQSIDIIYEVDPGDPDTLAEDVEDIDVAIRDTDESPREVEADPGVNAE